MANLIKPSKTGKTLFAQAQAYAATLPSTDWLVGLLQALVQATYDDLYAEITVVRDEALSENLSAQCDGLSSSFTLGEAFEATSLRVYWNGIRQPQGSTVTVTGSTTFSTTFVPDVSASLVVDYRTTVSRNDFTTTNLSAACNGVQTTFNVPVDFIATSLRVYWNGMRQTTGGTVAVLGATTFSTNFVPDTGDSLIVDYRIVT